MPSTVEPSRRASTACRCSYDTWSPIHAIVNGMMPAAAAPIAARLVVSTFSVGDSAAASVAILHAKVAMQITRGLPNRSPSGPYPSCNKP